MVANIRFQVSAEIEGGPIKMPIFAVDEDTAKETFINRVRFVYPGKFPTLKRDTIKVER